MADPAKGKDQPIDASGVAGALARMRGNKKLRASARLAARKASERENVPGDVKRANMNWRIKNPEYE